MSEYSLHLTVADWLRWQCPHLTWWHCGQTATSARHGSNLKRMGVQAGVPDLTFIIPPHGRIGFIELKAGKGKQTETQVTFEQRVRNDGALYAVCRSLEEVEGTLKGWGVLKERAA